MKSISVTDLFALSDPSVIDVREPEEFASGHVPRGISIPLADVKVRVGEIPENEPLYIICQSGRRSAQAAGVLGALGFNVVNVDGGTAAWVQAGLPVETS